MRRLRSPLAIAAIILVAVQVGVGMTFHSMDYTATREAWFTWHKTLGLSVPLVILIGRMWREPATGWGADLLRWNRWVLIAILLALPLLGFLAVSAWDGDDIVTVLLGGLRIPVIPGVSRDLGNFGEQAHKLLIQVMWVMVVLRIAVVAARR